MPKYSYKCDACGHEFTVRQRISEAALEECENCAGKVRRIITGGTGMIFKGSGFYKTDYRPKEKSDDSLKEKAKTESKSEKTKNSEKKDGGKATDGTKTDG